MRAAQLGDEDARDALQETFVKCWRHREQVDEVQNLKAWIFRIALNTGRDMRETAWRRKRQPLPDDGATLAGKQAGPDDRLLLGMKGTLSEMELSLLRQRSLEALKLKASIELDQLKGIAINRASMEADFWEQ